jgi:hypothetical protein
MIRENIYAELFNILQGLTIGGKPAFKTISRQLQMWSDVNIADTPALYIVQRSELARVVQKLPTIWELKLSLYLYVNTGGDTTKTPSSIFNPLVDAIEDILVPNPPALQEQLLGGLVTYCRIDGEILTDEGVLGDWGVVIIPIMILVPR